MENLQETVKRQEGIILSLNQTLESTKSSYNALFEENKNIKKQLSVAENKLLEDGIKWENSETKWKNREEELKKSLEEAWLSLRVKEERLTALNEKIKEITERDTRKSKENTFHEKNIKDYVEKVEEVGDKSMEISEFENNFGDSLEKQLEECKSRLIDQQKNFEETAKCFLQNLEEKDKMIQELQSKCQSSVSPDLQDAAAQTEFSDISLLTDLRSEIHSLQSEISRKENICELQVEEIMHLKSTLTENDAVIAENRENKILKLNLLECKNIIESTNEFVGTSVKAFHDKLSQKEVIISKLELFLKSIGYLINKYPLSSQQELPKDTSTDSNTLEFRETNSSEKNVTQYLTECKTCNKLMQEISVLKEKFIRKPFSTILEESYPMKSCSPDRTVYFNHDLKTGDMDLTLCPSNIKIPEKVAGAIEISEEFQSENCNKGLRVDDKLIEDSTEIMNRPENNSEDSFVNDHLLSKTVDNHTENLNETSSLAALEKYAVKCNTSSQTIIQEESEIKELRSKLQTQALILEKKQNEISNLLNEIQIYKDDGCREFKNGIEHIISKLVLFEVDLGSILDKKEKSLRKVEENFVAVKKIFTESLLSDPNLLNVIISLKNKIEILSNNIVLLDKQLQNKINDEDQKLLKLENTIGILSVEYNRLTKDPSKKNEHVEADEKLDISTMSKSLNIMERKIAEFMLEIDQKGQKVKGKIENDLKRINDLESKIPLLRQNYCNIQSENSCVCKQARNATGDATALQNSEGTLDNPDSSKLMAMKANESKSDVNYEMVPSEQFFNISGLDSREMVEKSEKHSVELWKQKESDFLREISHLQTKIRDQEKIERELTITNQELEINKQKQIENILGRVDIIFIEINKLENKLTHVLECKQHTVQKLEKQVELIISQLKKSDTEKESGATMVKSIVQENKQNLGSVSASKVRHHTLNEFSSNNSSVLCMSVYCETPEKVFDNSEFAQDLSTSISEDSQSETFVQQNLFEKSVFPSDLVSKEQLIMDDPLGNSNLHVMTDNEDSDSSQFGTPLASHSEIQERLSDHKMDEKVKLKLEFHQLQLDNALLTKDVSEYTNQMDKFKHDNLLLESKLNKLQSENEECKTYIEKYNNMLHSFTSLQIKHENLECEMKSLQSKYEDQNNLLEEFSVCKKKILEINQLFNENKMVDDSNLVNGLNFLHSTIIDLISHKNNLIEQYNDLKRSHETLLESDESSAERYRSLLEERENLQDKYITQTKSIADLKNNVLKLNELLNDKFEEIEDNDLAAINNRCLSLYRSVCNLISSRDELRMKHESLQKSFNDMIFDYEAIKNEVVHLNKENTDLCNLQIQCKNLETEIQNLQETYKEQEKTLLQQISDIKNCVVNTCNIFNISIDVSEDETNLIFYLNNIHNYITCMLSQNTELNSKHKNLEQTCSELAQSFDDLKKEYNEYKNKNTEICQTLEKEVQMLKNKCEDESMMLLKTTTTVKDLIHNAKHLFQLEFNATSEENLEEVLCHLKTFFQYASESASIKSDLSSKCKELKELNAYLEDNAQNLKQKYEELQSECEVIKSDIYNISKQKSEIQEKLLEILQFCNLGQGANMLEKSSCLFGTDNSDSEDSNLMVGLNLLHDMISGIISQKNNLIEQYNDLKRSHETLLESDERSAERYRNLLEERENLQDKYIMQTKSIADLKNNILKLNELLGDKFEEIAGDDLSAINNCCFSLYHSICNLISSKDELNVKYDALQKSFNDIIIDYEALKSEVVHQKQENTDLCNLQVQCKNLETEIQNLQETYKEQEKTLFEQISDIKHCMVNTCNVFNISVDVSEDETNLIFYLNNIHNYITCMLSQNTELNSKHNNLEQTCSELARSLEDLKKEYNEYKDKNMEICKTLEREVQMLKNKCEDQSLMLLNTESTIKDLIYDTKHLFQIEFNSSLEENLDEVLCYLKTFFQFASESALIKSELNNKCSEYNELNANLENNIDNLKQKYEKLLSEYEVMNSKNCDYDKNKLQLREQIGKIFQFLNVPGDTDLLEITCGEEIECLKKLNEHVRQLFEENCTLNHNSKINKTELDTLRNMLNCGDCSSSDIFEVWSVIKKKVKLILDCSSEKSIYSNRELEEKIKTLESNLIDADGFKRKLAVELHGMEPQKSVYDLMNMPPKDLYETFMNSIIEKEKILIGDIQNDCEAKITSLKEKLSQLVEENKRRQNWVQQLETENEKLSEECRQLKLECEEINNSVFPNRKESGGVSKDSNEIKLETSNGDCPKCKEIEKSQICEMCIEKEHLNSKLLLDLEEKQLEIKNLEISNIEKSNIIQELEAALSEKQKNIIHLLTTVDGKQDSINEHSKTIDELKATISLLEKSLFEMRNFNDELKTEINEKLNLIKNLEKQSEELESKNSIITKCENEISELKEKLEIASSNHQEQHSKFTEDLSSKLNIIKNLQLELEIYSNKCDKMEQEMNLLNSLKKDLEEKQLVVCDLREKVNALSQENVALEEKLSNELSANIELSNKLCALSQKNAVLEEKLSKQLLTNDQLKKENDEIKLKCESNTKEHHDETCPHKSAKEEANREIIELNKKHKEQLDNFLLMKNNLEEDIQYKSAKISELDNKLKAAHNIHKQALISKNELCEKLERTLYEFKEKDKRFDEKINIQRDMYLKEKKNLEIEINNNMQIITDLKEKIKQLETELDSRNFLFKEAEEKLKSQFDSFSNEIRMKNELITDLKEKLHLIETHNKEKLLLKHEISNKECIISDLKMKLEQSRKEIEITYIELTTLKNKILDLFSDKPLNIEEALMKIQKNLFETNDTNKQLTELKIKYTHLDEECDFLSSNIEHLEKQLGLTYKELEHVNSQLTEEKKKCKDIEEIKCQLEKELAEAKSEICTRKPALLLMEEKIKDLENNNAEWLFKYTSLEQKESKLTKLLEDCKREIVKLSDEIINKNWKVATLENRLQEENKLLQQKTDLIAEYKTKISSMKMENLKLQEKLDKMESVRSKETLIEKDKNIQVSPNPKILGDIRNAQIRQHEERIEKLEKERKIYKSLCQHRQKKIDELEKAMKALSVDKLPLSSSTSPLRNSLSSSK
ncbi:uncharacterized protein isoform X2 [Rhodnius prolixus]